jgi:CRISPR-associated protein Cmr4
MKHAKTLFLHTLTPLHSGTGQAAAVIDLPIAREKTTGWPVVPASSLKGVIRNGKDDLESNRRFGSLEAAGEELFGDLHLLCFPARSLYGTFAYLTCPLALKRYLREAKALGIAAGFQETDIPGLQSDDQKAPIAVADPKTLASGDTVILDDLDLSVLEGAGAAKIADKLKSLIFADAEDQELFKKRFAIVHDDLFSYLTQSACEVTARVSLKSDTKTVKKGGLWYEEAVPAEAIFHGPYGLSDHAPEDSAPEVESRLVQLGGNESVGRGWCRLRVSGGN